MPKHQLQSTGGSQAAAIYSGANAPGLGGATNAVAVGSDVLFHSGAGRLATISLHRVNTADAVNITFYDAVAPVSGGPLASSGHIHLGTIPATLAISPASGQLMVPSVQIPIGMPFRQGLCVNSRSGQPGFTITFSPDK